MHVRLYVCMYVCVHVCIYVCVHVYINVSNAVMHTYTFAYTFTCTCRRRDGFCWKHSLPLSRFWRRWRGLSQPGGTGGPRAGKGRMTLCWLSRRRPRLISCRRPRRTRPCILRCVHAPCRRSWSLLSPCCAPVAVAPCGTAHDPLCWCVSERHSRMCTGCTHTRDLRQARAVTGVGSGGRATWSRILGAAHARLAQLAPSLSRRT